MKIAFCLLFSALMFVPVAASAQTSEPALEPASIGPNGLNLGVTMTMGLGELVGLAPSGFTFGFGFAQHWRLDIGVNASARQVDLLQTANADTGEQDVESILTTSFSPSLAVHRLIRASEHARMYVGVRAGAAIHRVSPTGSTNTLGAQNDSLLAGGVLGGEILVFERLAVGVEAGFDATVHLPAEERSVSGNRWNISTNSRLLVRYYF